MRVLLGIPACYSELLALGIHTLWILSNDGPLFLEAILDKILEN